jgi:hypothetical protein
LRITTTTTTAFGPLPVFPKDQPLTWCCTYPSLCGRRRVLCHCFGWCDGGWWDDPVFLSSQVPTDRLAVSRPSRKPSSRQSVSRHQSKRASRPHHYQYHLPPPPNETVLFNLAIGSQKKIITHHSTTTTDNNEHTRTSRKQQYSTRVHAGPHCAGSRISMWRLWSSQCDQGRRSGAMPSVWVSYPLQDTDQAMWVPGEKKSAHFGKSF